MGIPAWELQRRMPPSEFREHMADDRIEPWGDVRGDMQAALVATIIANANRGKRQRPYKIKDFLFRWNEKRPKRQTWQEQKAVWMAYARAHNASRKR